MILTREQVDRYEKCWNCFHAQDCDDCCLQVTNGSGYNGCMINGNVLIDTIRHYMAESAAKDARIAELEAERDRWEKVATGFRDMIGNPMPGQGERLQVLAAYEAAKEARG